MRDLLNPINSLDLTPAGPSWAWPLDRPAAQPGRARSRTTAPAKRPPGVSAWAIAWARWRAASARFRTSAAAPSGRTTCTAGWRRASPAAPPKSALQSWCLRLARCTPVGNETTGRKVVGITHRVRSRKERRDRAGVVRLVPFSGRRLPPCLRGSAARGGLSVPVHWSQTGGAGPRPCGRRDGAGVRRRIGQCEGADEHHAPL